MTATISAERASELIGMIYDCAVAPERWERTIDAIRLELDFVNCVLAVTTLPKFDIVLDVAVGVPSIWRERMSHYTHAVPDIWGGVERMQYYPLDEPVVQS